MASVSVDADDGDDDEEQSIGGVVHHLVEGHRLGTVCHRFRPRPNIPSQEGPSSRRVDPYRKWDIRYQI